MALIERCEPYPDYSDYRRYKSHLRLDFSYRCCYCTIHEREWGGLRHFHVEHFRPKSQFPEFINDYENLMYACNVCNSFKGEDWPSDDPISDGVGYLDPCYHDYDDHFQNDTNSGVVSGMTPAAEYMTERLHLNRKHLTQLRRKRAEEKELYHRFNRVCEQALAMMDHSLEDATLPEHAIRALELAEDVIQTLWKKQRELWETRLEPPYEPHDLR